MTTNHSMIFGRTALALGLAVSLAGCEGSIGGTPLPGEPHELSAYVPPPPTPNGPGPQYDRFRAFDESGADVYGVKGFLPPNSELSDVYAGMTESQRIGLSTWHLFASENGDFFRVSQKVTWNGQNMIRVLDSRGRDDRFTRTAVITTSEE